MNASSASVILLLLALAVLTPFSPLSPRAALAAAPASSSNAPVSDSPDAPDAPAEPTTPDPVGYASGNVYEAATDVRVRCPDVDLAFRRAYCSGSPSVGDLGRGWTHSYEGGVSELAYDALGRVASVTRPGPGGAERVTRFVRNWRGRPTEVVLPDGAAERFAYDGEGARAVSRTDALGREDVYRWTLGLPVHAARVAGGVTNALFSVSHDLRLNVVAVADPLGRKAESYVLDECGRVVAATNLEGQVMTLRYALGDMVEAETRFDGTAIGGFRYAYDAAGRVVSREHRLGTNRFDRAYAYDALDRLVADGDILYEYDAAGNRTAKRGGADGAVAYALGDGDRLASWTGGAYEHDAAGCVTHIVRDGTTLDLAWNGVYQLVSVATNGVFAESYSYDALGRRVSTTNAEGTERHVYDESRQVIADVDESGNVVRSYEWGEGIDRLLAVKVGGRIYTALTDVQGTVWGYADEGGAIVARWTYDAWGNVLSEEIADGAEELRCVRYRFQGRERSAATSLVNFRMRWYDPMAGRWLSKDPIGLGGGLNLYAFCGGDAINLVDPIGWAHIATRPLDAGGNKAQQALNDLRLYSRVSGKHTFPTSGTGARRLTILASGKTGCKHANDRPSWAFGGPGAVFTCSQPCAAGESRPRCKQAA